MFTYALYLSIYLTISLPLSLTHTHMFTHTLSLTHTNTHTPTTTTTAEAQALAASSSVLKGQEGEDGPGEVAILHVELLGKPYNITVRASLLKFWISHIHIYVYVGGGGDRGHIYTPNPSYPPSHLNPIQSNRNPPPNQINQSINPFNSPSQFIYTIVSINQVRTTAANAGGSISVAFLLTETLRRYARIRVRFKPSRESHHTLCFVYTLSLCIFFNVFLV